MTLLTALTAALVLGFFVVLAVALVAISNVLSSIGGTPTSFLAKLRLGLRAIEQETSHLAPEVVAANTGLSSIAGGLAAVDKALVGTIDAVSAQKV
jgi:hypothetical protein